MALVQTLMSVCKNLTSENCDVYVKIRNVPVGFTEDIIIYDSVKQIMFEKINIYIITRLLSA